VERMPDGRSDTWAVWKSTVLGLPDDTIDEYLARVEGRSVGGATLYVHGAVGYLADSATDPAFRRRGVHTALLMRRIEAAKAAGVIHQKFYGKTLNIQFKGHNSLNLVTQVDKLSEKKILSILQKQFPAHDFLEEESGLQENNSAYTWVIDPLDGTTNFAHGFPP